MDTIFAVSSGAPPAAIAVIRVSGPGAFAAARALSGPLPVARRASLRTLRDPADGRPLDRALLVAFPAPHTATGEDLVELHVHGGRAVVAAIEDALARQGGLRPARAGEFTRMALANGVIDLTEAEGLGDLLAAETETQRRAALEVAHGSIRRLVESLGTTILGIAARIEAQLDFSDEDDVAVDDRSATAIRTDIAAVADRIATVLASPPAERLRDGIRVVIVGPPNSGKSTLLNCLVARDAAIVSPISGTTRDRIEAPVVVDGVAYLLIDTAGLAEASEDAIERIGIARARDAMATADIVLWLGDDAPRDPEHLWIHARCDVPSRAVPPPGARLSLSAETGVGVAALWRDLADRSRAMVPRADEVTINRRQRAALATALAHLRGALAERDDLLQAEELRLALRAFDTVTGRNGTEEMLDALFSHFCIGK